MMTPGAFSMSDDRVLISSQISSEGEKREAYDPQVVQNARVTLPPCSSRALYSVTPSPVTSNSADGPINEAEYLGGQRQSGMNSIWELLRPAMCFYTSYSLDTRINTFFGINSHQLVSKGYRVTNGTGSSDLWCWDGNGELFRFSLEIRSSFRPPF